MKNILFSRRSFLGFFLAGGIISFLKKKIMTPERETPARFWRKKDEA